MPIDWFTVIAQGINFLLLLWLLKHFLYHPIIDGLDAREKKIAGILADTDTSKAQAENLRTEYESKLAQIKQERTQLVGEAKNEAQTASQNLLDDARHNAEQIVKKRVEALRLEMAELKQDVLQQNIQEVYALSRKVLTELADGDLQTKMIDKLVQRLNTVDVISMLRLPVHWPIVAIKLWCAALNHLHRRKEHNCSLAYNSACPL